MARWWRRRASDDGRVAGTRPPHPGQEQQGGQEHGAHTDGQAAPGTGTRQPAQGPGDGRRPAGGRIVATIQANGGPERETAHLELSTVEIHTMRARSAIDTLGPEHPDALTAMRELARALVSVQGRGGEEAVELYQHVARTQWTGSATATRKPSAPTPSWPEPSTPPVS